MIASNVSPGSTVMSGPGEDTVDDVKPQPAGVEILPNKEIEVGAAWRRTGENVSPRTTAIISRVGRTIELRNLGLADMGNLLPQ